MEVGVSRVRAAATEQTVAGGDVIGGDVSVMSK